MYITEMVEEELPTEVDEYEASGDEPPMGMIEPEDATEDDSVPTEDVDIPGEDEDVDNAESITDGIDIAQVDEGEL